MATAEKHGKLLDDFIKGNNLTIERVADYLEKSRPFVYALIKKGKFSRSEMALVCTVFGLSPSFFGEDGLYFKTPYNQINRNYLADFICISSYQSDRDGLTDLIGKYFGIIADHFVQAERRVSIYDYLGRSRNALASAVYTGAQGEYFRKLEDSLRKNKEGGFKYERILALPKLYDNHNNEALQGLGEALVQAVRLLYKEAFFHLVRCFQEFDATFDLYCLGVPTRLYHYGIVDKKYLISAYDRHDESGTALPDLLFVEKITDLEDTTDPVRTLLDVYDREVAKITSELGRSPQRRVTKAIFIHSVYSLRKTIAEDKSRRLELLAKEEDGLSSDISLDLERLKKIDSQRRFLKALEEDERDIEEKFQFMKNQFSLKGGDLY
ncbi:MAG: hypothetical protein GC192_21280 [Bacteroidetes bacterium]|nr:hypothetical protein [Bacteroidota bacterium]